MNEITQTNLNIIPAEDIEFLTKQSTAEIGKIVAEMTALMRDTNTRVGQLESQGWFQRMCKTVTGSNKASREEIQKNNAKLGAYMAEAVSVLYDRQLIDEKMITNLGLQINMLYADHNQLKKQLGAFAQKLNKKIESVDNYHLLFEEITLGHYSDIAPILAICEITSQLDERVMKDERRLKNLKEIIIKQEIINDEQKQITEYLNDMFALPAESIGQVAMEFSTLYEKSPIAQLLLGITENYHYLPETAKKMKKKSAIVEHVLNEYEIDDSVTFSTRDIYEDFVKAKSEIYENSVVVHLSEEEISNVLYSDAEKARKANDYERAFDLYHEAANLGNVEAMYSIGWVYDNGIGLEEDDEKAFKWYSKAADLGSDEAMCSLADMYYDGKGVEQNYEEAFKWYSKAADLGIPDAIDSLANMYYDGVGVEQNYEEAFKWYCKSWEGYRNSDVGNRLGWMYQHGLGVQQNYERAFEWYSKVVDLDRCSFDKKIAMNNLGYLYYEGKGVQQDYKVAFKWFSKAAKAGCEVAMDWLGECYAEGTGVAKNYKKAIEWYRKAVLYGHEASQEKLDRLL